jgi:hypothetical protein
MAVSPAAHAQTPPQSVAASPGWNITIYPVFLWLPYNISIDVDVPPDGGDDGAVGNILESRFDGAYFGGVTATNGTWRFEGNGIWAAFGGDRPSLPFLDVDIDIIYGDARVGRRVAGDVYVTGGLRRIAIDYDITLGSLAPLNGKPGFWDPIVGVGWHRRRPKFELHATFEGGGFGVGSDVELAGSFRVDWKPIPHFGVTAGYGGLYFKTTNAAAGRTVILAPTLHGPMFGIGLYF